MRFETNVRMNAVSMRIRTEVGAKTMMEGQYPSDLSTFEQVVAQRLSELWKQGEAGAVLTIEDRVHEGTVQYSLGIRRADGSIESYANIDKEDPIVNDTEQKPDYVNHPPHYATHPSGVECVDIAEHLTFNLGNALKYLWRAKNKGREEEDLQKCLWYLEREVRFNNLAEKSMFLIDKHARFGAQKAVDKEGKTSGLGKFLAILANGSDPHGENVLGELQKIVRAEIKIVKAGDSR